MKDKIKDRYKEMVLRHFLNKTIENNGSYYSDLKLLCKSLPQIKPIVLRTTLVLLRDEDLIEYRLGRKNLTSIHITPKGLDYFERKKRLKAMAKQKLSLRSLVVPGFILGVMSGLTVAYVAYRYWM